MNVTQCGPSAQAQKARKKKKINIKGEKERESHTAILSQLEECKHVSAQKTMLQHADKHTHLAQPRRNIHKLKSNFN